MRRLTEADLPVWTDDALHRLLGACDGYIHSISSLRMAIEQLQYRQIPRRHVRLIREHEKTIAPLREVEARLTANLRACQEAYKRQSSRSALAQSEDVRKKGD